MFRHLRFFLAGLFLLGCTQQPKIPFLPNNTPERDGILLRGDLHAADLRSIFHAINRNGRLDALKPYLETPSDTELETIAGLANRQIYRELDSAKFLRA